MNVLHFVTCFQQLIDRSLIEKDMITRHDKSNKGNLHSKLIYLFIQSIDENKYTALPEIKLQFKNPMNNPKTGKKQWNYKTDIAIYEKNKIKGICEVFTLDMCSNYIVTSERDGLLGYKLGQLTSADKIIHLFENPPWASKIDFYLLGVLPKKVEQKPGYSDVKKIFENEYNLYEVIQPQILRLFSRLNETTRSCNSLIITEDGFYYNGERVEKSVLFS